MLNFDFFRRGDKCPPRTPISITKGGSVIFIKATAFFQKKEIFACNIVLHLLYEFYHNQTKIFSTSYLLIFSFVEYFPHIHRSDDPHRKSEYALKQGFMPKNALSSLKNGRNYPTLGEGGSAGAFTWHKDKTGKK